jgi:hypothetical protein
VLGGEYPVVLYMRNLSALKCYLKNTKTNSAYLSCIIGTCGKVLGCGHAICNTCVRTLAIKSGSKSNNFLVKECPLYGEANRKPPFRLILSTAGVRALSLDSGGIKGIIPLIVL